MNDPKPSGDPLPRIPSIKTEPPSVDTLLRTMNPIPPIPQIVDPDAILEVFTHKSIRHDDALSNEQFGNSERLAGLGTKALDLAVTYALFSRRPMLNAEEIEEEHRSTLSETNIEDWVDAYKLREKLRYAKDARETINSPEETRYLLDAYIGAVYIRSGLEPIQRWVSQLVNPGSEPSFSGTWSSPPQPSEPPPPAPPSTVTTASFNEKAVRARLLVTYDGQSTGPSHRPIWAAKCLVDGQEKGRGRGNSLKEAKEEAAKKAWVAMGYWMTSRRI
jgi:dsRNA-specific ribonuclease